MGITVQFESYEEMVQFANKLVSGDVKPIKKQKQGEIQKDKSIKEEAPAEDANPIPNQQQIEEEAAGEEVTFTLEEVRAKLTELTRSGKQKEVKAILTSVKAKNLTAVDPKNYATVMKKAGEL